MLPLLMACYITVFAVNSESCRFGNHLRGMWVRSFDFQDVTFNEDEVTGFKVKVSSNELSKFKCHNVSGDVYTIRANFEDKTGKTMSYYECWKFERLNGNVFIMYDLSETRHFLREWMKENRSYFDEQVVPPFSTICPRDVLNEPYAILYRKDMAAKDLGVPCPPTLVGHYTPDFECDESDINFCNLDHNGLLSMKHCKGVADAMFETGGSLTCVGHKYKCPYVHASIFHLDRVDCFVFPETDIHNVMEGTVYFGDCTMVGRSQVSYPLKLGLINRCPDDSPPIANRTHHCEVEEIERHSSNTAVATNFNQWLCLLVIESSTVLLHV
ncbi:hypothetical protein Btru_039658 [Bulinus truncatus]|nr:hypothetical protein Btru_039658 [Bulinus truncatus]